MTNIDRVQGLIDWYPAKCRNAIMTMADYWLSQGVMTSDDVAAVVASMDAIDEEQAPIDIAEIITARDSWMGSEGQTLPLIEATLLKAQVQALTTRGEFLEDVVAELAMMVL